jgi:hypothetical protein
MGKNKVVAGDYEGKALLYSYGKLEIINGFLKTIPISKDTVEEYEVIDESSRKSAASAVGRGFVGGLVLGPVGLLAGISAKSKGTHIVAIQFKDGKKSLLDLNDKYYNGMVKILF